MQNDHREPQNNDPPALSDVTFNKYFYHICNTSTVVALTYKVSFTKDLQKTWDVYQCSYVILWLIVADAEQW